MEFIEGHTESVLNTFGRLLEKVKAYLIENNVFEGNEESVEPEGEQSELDVTLIDSLINALIAFNIKDVENGVNECVHINYGTEINKAFRDIKSCLDVFDYHKAKELLTDLRRRQDESGI